MLHSPLVLGTWEFMGAKHYKVKKSMQRVDHGKKIAVIVL
jgi:hypothetical protein